MQATQYGASNKPGMHTSCKPGARHYFAPCVLLVLIYIMPLFYIGVLMTIGVETKGAWGGGYSPPILPEGGRAPPFIISLVLIQYILNSARPEYESKCE